MRCPAFIGGRKLGRLRNDQIEDILFFKTLYLWTVSYVFLLTISYSDFLVLFFSYFVAYSCMTSLYLGMSYAFNNVSFKA